MSWARRQQAVEREEEAKGYQTNDDEDGYPPDAEEMRGKRNHERGNEASCNRVIGFPQEREEGDEEDEQGELNLLHALSIGRKDRPQGHRAEEPPLSQEMQEHETGNERNDDYQPSQTKSARTTSRSHHALPPSHVSPPLPPSPSSSLSPPLSMSLPLSPHARPPMSLCPQLSPAGRARSAPAMRLLLQPEGIVQARLASSESPDTAGESSLTSLSLSVAGRPGPSHPGRSLTHCLSSGCRRARIGRVNGTLLQGIPKFAGGSGQENLQINRCSLECRRSPQYLVKGRGVSKRGGRVEGEEGWRPKTVQWGARNRGKGQYMIDWKGENLRSDT
eukprot:753476-Hanusia_phi.AAC.9